MKIMDGFLVRDVGGANVAVPLGKEARALQCIVNLNASGTLLFKRLQRGATSAELTRELLDVYDVREDEAARAVEDFTRQLSAANLLET